MPISNRDDLHRHLQWALELEHSTIPPYLCALFSLEEGANREAAEILRGIAMEEMLHMALAANVLNAVGGKPAVDRAEFVPGYPTFLPHSDDAFKVELLPFSPEAVDTFLRIERPAAAGAPPEGDRYRTIGQFYEAIERGLKELAATLGEAALFSGKLERQVRPEQWYYGAGGTAVVVLDLATALRAIGEIREQGEGLDHTIFDGDRELGERKELAHYFRFEEIRAGRRYRAKDTPRSGPTGAEVLVDWSAVHRMGANPKAEGYRDRPDVHRLMVEFNRTYSDLLRLLHRAFDGGPGLLFESVPAMYRLKYQARALMKIPSGRGDGTTVGPSFEYEPALQGQPVGSRTKPAMRSTGLS